MDITPEQLCDLIRRRRTIKPGQMDSRPVPSDCLDALLESANWAPTHGMTEPWRFFVFRGAARQRLGQFLHDTYREESPAEEFKPGKAEKLLKNPTLAPVVIALGMKRQESGKIPEIEEVEAVACAVQNLHLAATAYGLGGFWSSNIAACSDSMRAFLGMSPGDRVLGLFYLGYPAVQWPDGERSSITEKVVWHDE